MKSLWIRVVSVVLLMAAAFPALAQEQNKESVYARVMRTNTLRCGYILYPAEVMQDPNTGALSGLVVETVSEIGKQLGWKIDWAVPVGHADMFEGFKTGKYDALCSGLWKNPNWAKQALFTRPIDYGIFYAYVRADDTRFDQGLTAINDPSIKIAVVDGEYGQFVARDTYPNAQTMQLPQLTDMSMILESVATSKADVAFLAKAHAAAYIKNNPGKLKVIDRWPVRVMPAPVVVLPSGEHDLHEIVDAAVEYLLNNGTIEQILRKYDPELGSYNLIAKPYEIQK